MKAVAKVQSAGCAKKEKSLCAGAGTVGGGSWHGEWREQPSEMVKQAKSGKSPELERDLRAQMWPQGGQKPKEVTHGASSVMAT